MRRGGLSNNKRDCKTPRMDTKTRPGHGIAVILCSKPVRGLTSGRGLTHDDVVERKQEKSG
jgi:hypothetical protein